MSRPGSSGSGPISSTRHEERNKARPAPTTPSERGDESFADKSWPVLLVSAQDSSGNPTDDRPPSDPNDETKFAPYAPDDETVLRKMFRLNI